MDNTDVEDPRKNHRLTRLRALKYGDRMYVGSLCRLHPENRGQRYTHSMECTECKRLGTKDVVLTGAGDLYARLMAREEGTPRYAGMVCAKHPELKGERAAGTGKCTGCSRDDSKAHYAKQKARKQRGRK